MRKGLVMIPSFYLQKAIARIESTGVSVGTASVRYTFRNHPYINSNYNGIVIVRIGQDIPTGTTTTLPIVFNSGGQDMPVTLLDGVAMTAADIEGTGVYLFYYNSDNGTIQAIQTIG